MINPTEWDIVWSYAWVGEAGESHLPHPLVVAVTAYSHVDLIEQLKALHAWHAQHGIAAQTDWGIVGWQQTGSRGLDVGLTLGYREVQSAVLARMMWT